MELQLSLNFNQLISLIHKLPVNEKVKLAKAIEEDISEIIPEEHKKLVRNRIKSAKSNKKEMLKWDDIKDSFDLGK